MSKIENINCVEDLDGFLNQTEEKYLIVNFCGKDGMSDNAVEILDKVIQNADKINKLSFGEMRFVFTYEKIEKKYVKKLCELQAKLENKSVLVDVNHSFHSKNDDEDEKISWDLKTIIKANTEIDKVCDFIKKNNFSPFEAFAYIHDYVSTIANYKSSKSNLDWFHHDQFFAGAYMDIPEVVCAGYSSLMKEIIDNLNMPGLKCDLLSVTLSHNEEYFTVHHVRCMITIDDKKYGLNQTMFDDPTWDNSQDLATQYANFAMPNNVHDKNISNLYDYEIPFETRLEKGKTQIVKTRESMLQKTFDQSKNKIDQLMIEKAYFNVLMAKNKNLSCYEIYQKLEQSAKASFKDQKERKYVGNLQSEKLILTRKMAQKIFEQNQRSQEELEF